MIKMWCDEDWTAAAVEALGVAVLEADAVVP
jgi:hypothetical protein